MNETTHVYCTSCQDIEPMNCETIWHLSDDGRYLGGEIFCDTCKLIIATIYNKREDA